MYVCACMLYMRMCAAGSTVSTVDIVRCYTTVDQFFTVIYLRLGLRYGGAKTA